MAFEQTWRWFGPKDPISLKEIKQTGAAGIVTALHQIPVGEVWPVEEILKRKEVIQSEGLTWSVVESVPVHEDIKKRNDRYKEYIGNYKQTIKNLGKCGIDTVCYNFMPVLDWSRTDLKVERSDGSITTKFEMKALAAFDLFILKRAGAEKNYKDDQIKEAKLYYDSLNEQQKKTLQATILLGLPGSLETYTLEEFKSAIKEYEGIGDAGLRENLYYFIREITPAAEESGVYLTIHADDPPFSLLGLPRIVSSGKDIQQLLDAYNSFSNGLTLCTGSLGSGLQNNLIEITERFADRINFIHLRNVRKSDNGDFIEENLIEGDIDIYSVMKILLLEQKQRLEKEIKNARMPMRPDHGHLMLPEQNTHGIYPGYSLLGRMKGLAELRGLETGISRSLTSKKNIRIL